MRILLTGGSGFIGRNLNEHLSRAHEVLAPGRSELDVSDPDALDRWFDSHRVDAVIHGALRPGHRNAPDPSRQLWTNLRMFFGLVRNAHRFGRLVLLSSGAVYDIAHAQVRTSEAQFGTYLPEDEHGLSKYVMANYLSQARALGTADVVELRLFGVFGKHEDYAIRFVSNAICKALFGMPITLRQNRAFSYLYVDDLGPIVEHFLEGRPSEAAFNVVPDWVDELYDLAELVRVRSGKDIPIVVGAPGSGLPYSASNDRLRREIPSVAFTSTSGAINALYEWYESNIARIDRTALAIDK